MRDTDYPAGVAGTGCRQLRQAAIWLAVCALLANSALAASYEFVALENLLYNPGEIRRVHPRAIVVTSSRQRFGRLPRNMQSALDGQFIYQTRVRIDGADYYRLAVGNFASLEEARRQLRALRPIFADAWIYQRNAAERQALEARLSKAAVAVESPAPARPAMTAEERLQKAREAFIDREYALAVSLANRVVQQGDAAQTRAALELAGAARERQGRYGQAMTLYQTLLDTDPEEEQAARIEQRMQGIRTMSQEPRARLPESEKNADEDDWVLRGVLQQYYRDDVIDDPDEGSESVNRLLVTDIDLQLQRRTERNSLAIDIDAGLLADLSADSSDSRVSEASFSYTGDALRVIAGRQHRTLRGVYASMDGITLVDLARSGLQASYFAGSLAPSAYDGLQSERPLLGVNIDLAPYDWLDLHFYLVHQEVSDLTDRQAVGGEFQLRYQSAFIHGLVDYDVFYDDLNNIRLVSSYRQSPQWTFNLTLSEANTPMLSTVNALYGQTQDSVEDLADSFSDDQIYQLAQDRTAKSRSLYFGSIYTLDEDRQLNLDVSLSELDAIPASGGVAAVAANRDASIALDYSIRNLFSSRDYTTLGLRLADSDTSDIRSLRLRSRISGTAGLTYDPRLQLDFRRSSAGVDQTIVKPSLRLRYRAGSKFSLETDLGIEYSDLDLPDFDRQTAYSLYLGYAYFF